MFYEWDYEVLYTDAQLTRMHRHFYHPTPDRLFSLMKRAEDPSANTETYAQLEQISRKCDIRQRYEGQPGRFRVSILSEDIVFNRTILMDLNVPRHETRLACYMQRHLVQCSKIPEWIINVRYLERVHGDLVQRIRRSPEPNPRRPRTTI